MFGDPRLPERFWDKVMTEPNTGCWLWTGQVAGGFGRYRHPGGHEPSHRVAFHAFVGSREGFGNKILHSCGEKTCCNPDHLYAKPVSSRGSRRVYKNEWKRAKRASNPEAARQAARAEYANNATVRREAAMRWRNANVETAREATRQWRERNPHKIKEAIRTARFKRYGITEEMFVEMLVRQENRCAICAREFSVGKTGVANIDHCHATKRVRGLLCGRCNKAIGLLDDERERLAAAIRYLETA